MDVVFSSRPDLKDIPLDKYDMQLFTAGSSSVVDGKRYAGYAVVSLEEIAEARPLTPGTSAQLAEIIALTRGLELSKDKMVNKGRGLITSAGKEVKYAPDILKLLDAVRKPSSVSVIHCRGHQKGREEVPRGNRKAVQAAKEDKVKSSQQQVQQQGTPDLERFWRGNPDHRTGCPVQAAPLKSVRDGNPDRRRGNPVHAETHLKGSPDCSSGSPD